MSGRNMRLTSLRPETLNAKKKLPETGGTPRSLRYQQRSERLINVSKLKLRTPTNIQLGDNVLEKRKDCAGIDPASPSAKRSKIRPVPCAEKENSHEQTQGRVLRPRNRQAAIFTNCCTPGGFRKVHLSEEDFFEVINRRIKVFWDIDNKWYSGRIKRYDPTNRLHHIVYDDRDEEWVSLERDTFVLQVLPGDSSGKHGGPRDDPQGGGINDARMAGSEESQKRGSTRGERLRTDAELSRDGDADADDGFGASTFSSGSHDVCESGFASQSEIDECSANLPGAADDPPGEPAKRRTVVKTYYRKRRRKLRNSERVGGAGKGIRLLSSEKAPNVCCRKHQSELQRDFVPNVEMEICVVEVPSGLRKLCFLGALWQVMMEFSEFMSGILRSEGNGCPVVVSGAPGIDVLPSAVQSVTVRFWTPSSPHAHCLECRDKWTNAMFLDLNGFLREIGTLQSFTSPASGPLALDGSVYTFRPGIGFLNDIELNNTRDRYFISGLSFENLIPQCRSVHFLCASRRRRDSIVVAKSHREFPSVRLYFGAEPQFFMSLHLKLLLGNMSGLSYAINGPDVNNSKAGVVGCNSTVFPASSGHQMAFGEDLTAHGVPFSDHSQTEAIVSTRNIPDDSQAESSSRLSNYSTSVAIASAGRAFNQDIPGLPVLKFRTTDYGKWRLVGISKLSSTEQETFQVIGSGVGNSGPVEFCPSGNPSLSLEIGGDGPPKPKIARRRRGRPSRKDKEDRITEIPMDSSNTGPDLASLACSANILITGEDRCWRESDAIVTLEYSALNEWLLAVKLHGLTKYTHKPPRELKSGTPKRNTHSIIWKGGRDWKLEFLDTNEWNLFKEMHGECYSRNLRAASIRCIPIPGVRLLEDDDCRSNVPFARPSLMYIQMADCETTRALSSSRVVYDMDSDDEEWLSRFNSGVPSDGGCKLAEGTFEKTIDKLEKAGFGQQCECLGEGEVAKVCSGLAPVEVLMAVHAYWLEKRNKAGMALVRQLRVSPSADQIQPGRKKLLQKQRSIKLSIGGRHLVRRNRGIERGGCFKLDPETRVCEARACVQYTAELAANKRAKAQRLMQIADLATYRAVAISKNAEAIQAIETSCFPGQFPNENYLNEELSAHQLGQDRLKLIPWVDPNNMEVENKIQLQHRQPFPLNCKITWGI